MKAGGARVRPALMAVIALFVAACGETSHTAMGATLRVVPPPEDVPVAMLPAAAPETDLVEPSPPPAVAPARVGSPPRRARRAPTARGRIMIPSIGVDLETYEGVDDWTLRFGPSHWDVTARPGQKGNTTFAGHRTTYTRPFHDIDLIRPGDEVIFVNHTGTYTYKATHAFVVEETDVWIAEPTETPTFTLFACHPKGSERQRYVVKGDLEHAEPAAAERAPEAPEREPTRQPRTCVLCGAL